MRKLVHGRISITSKGEGYVRLTDQHEKLDKAFDKNESIFIDHEHLNCALHGDTVEVEVLGRKTNEKTGADTFFGKVLSILERAKYAHAGKLEEANGLFFLVPDDKKTYTDFIIPKEDTLEAKVGDKVVAEITTWDDPKKTPFAKVIQVLGRPGENDAEMLAFALERGFSNEHSAEVLAEANAIKELGITKEDEKIDSTGLTGRRDFREIITFTIDPADAKDFDDALSFQTLEKGNYEIGIHIADVSHYLKEGMKMNDEAIKRETSVYLVDRTIPMLPEVLSNDLCSLVEGEDRLVMSAVFKMNLDGEVLEEWYGRSLIKSNKRFTYEEAQTILEAGGLYEKEIQTLNQIAKKLEAKKIKEGALVIDTEEVKFKLDEKGVPVDVYVKERKDANKLIEEFMLLANRRVSKFIYETEVKNNEPKLSIYRVHDKPEAEKMHELALFIRSLGENVKFIDGLIPTRELNQLLKRLEQAGKVAEKDLLSMHISRTMQKAIYSTNNIGHYGLAFPFYSHFTSPIRRYPDVLLHRILMRVLKKDWLETSEKGYLDRMCELASQREKEAQEAERGSIKYKQVEYMSYRVGQEFVGVISGVSQWGVYVEELKSKSEGMVRLRDLGEDFYMYDEKKSLVYGENSGATFRIGDRVKIKVKSTNLDLKLIDYQLL